MKYSDKQRIEKIYEYGSKLLAYLQENKISKEDLLKDAPLQWLVTTPLYNIGEHSYYLTDKYKELHSEIPWAMISGMRHRLVHNYEGTNWNIIVEVIFEELPKLMEQIDKLLEQ